MQEPAHDYRRVTYGGKTVNWRTRIMLEAAATLYGEPFKLTQGSYNKGVSASAGTHDGGGVVDISTAGMSTARREFAEQCLRRVGFFAWVREPPLFSYHIHAVAIGDREMSSSAKSQVAQGYADKDGLARRGHDSPLDPYPVWIDQYGRHVSLDRPDEPAPEEDEMKLVTRVQWGGPVEAPGKAAEVRQGLAVHYNGPALDLVAKGHGACAPAVKAMHNYHLSKSWSGIGYAWLICPHGYVFEGRGFDRTQAAQPGGNSSHQSVQFMIGGDEKLTADALRAWYQLRDFLRSDGVGNEIKPHSDWTSTTCPGDYLRNLIGECGTLGLKSVVTPANPKPAPKPKAKTKPWIWEHGPWVGNKVTNTTRIVQRALNEEFDGRDLLVDGKFGPVTRGRYSQWQERLGFTGDDANGIPGPFSLNKLGDKYGFDVRTR